MKKGKTGVDAPIEPVVGDTNYVSTTYKPFDANTVDSVYAKHRANILGDESSDEPKTSTTPSQHEQGHYIETINTFARARLKDDDATYAKCMTLKSVDRVCHYIAKQEGGLLPTKVYMALGSIGYGKRYHNMKIGNPDELHKIKECVSDCIDTCDIDIIDEVNDSMLFRHSKSKTFRVNKERAAENAKEAIACGVNQSELTLYNVLTGIEALLSEEQHYIERRDKRLFRIPMDEFISARRKIGFKVKNLRNILEDK